MAARAQPGRPLTLTLALTLALTLTLTLTLALPLTLALMQAAMLLGQTIPLLLLGYASLGAPLPLRHCQP